MAYVSLKGTTSTALCMYAIRSNERVARTQFHTCHVSGRYVRKVGEEDRLWTPGPAVGPIYTIWVAVPEITLIVHDYVTNFKRLYISYFICNYYINIVSH